MAVYEGHKLWVTSITVVGDRLYSSSADRSVIEWNTETGQESVISGLGLSNWPGPNTNPNPNPNDRGDSEGISRA